MPYKTLKDLPDWVKKMPVGAQKIWRSAFNSAYKKYKDEERAFKIAISAVKRIYKKVGDKWVRRKKASFSFPICLSETSIKKTMEINIMPVGEWKKESGLDEHDDIKITEEDIQDFVDNFDKGIRKGVSITEGHDNGMSGGELPAIGWFKKLINKKEKGLWGLVEWTDKGRELLKQKAYKYFSPEFYSVYEDPETHRVYNNVLTGGALTNSPYFKGLKSIVMSEIMDQFNQEKNMSEKTKDKKNLSEEETEEAKETSTEETKEVKEEEEKTDLGCGCAGEDKVVETEKTEEENKDEIEETKEMKEDEKSEKNLSEEKKQDKIVYQVMSSGDIDLEEKKDLSEFKKELLKVGEWRHVNSKDGILRVTIDTLKSIVKNFKDKVLDNVFVPLGHPEGDDPSKNVGEVVDLAIEGEKLMSTIDVKEKSVIDKIKNGLIKGISASLVENYMKKDTGEEVGPILFHAALVGEPYVKGMGGFATVPLSEEWKDSKIIQIFNIEEVMTLSEIGERIKKIEDKLRLSEENKTSEEVTKEEETSEEKTEEKSEEKTEEKTEEESKEETSTEETSKEDEKETKEEETKVEETKVEETESSEGSEKTTEEEEETKTEETKTEETKPEAEEAEQGVGLAEAERMYEKLLNEGKVTPAERELVVPLLVSDTEIELSGGTKVASGKALFEYLNSQSPKIPLSERGVIDIGEKKQKKEGEIPEEINQELEKMNLGDPEDRKDIYNDFKGMNEKKETTLF